MKSEFKLLKEENDLRISTLSRDSREELAYASKILRPYSWSDYEIERVRKDLIDIAARAERDGSSLRESIGSDRNGFYRQLCEGIDPGLFPDCIGSLGQFYLWTWFAVILFGCLADFRFSGSLLSNQINWMQVFLHPLAVLASFFLVSFLYRKLYWKCDTIFQKIFFFVALYVSFSLPFIAYNALYYRLLPTAATLPAIWSAAGMLILAVGTRVWYTRRGRKMAEKHPWR